MVIKRGMKILGCFIIGFYVYIGEDCVIENLDVSDLIVFRGIIFKNVMIWCLIIDEKCEIRNFEFKKSLVGGYVKI